MNNEQVTKYIEKQAPLQKELLTKLRKLIHQLAPEALEAMSYGVPAFKLDNKNLIVYAGFKEHIGIYPEPSCIKAFEKELKGYETSKGTIKFKISSPLPIELIKRIIKYRLKEVYKK